MERSLAVTEDAAVRCGEPISAGRVHACPGPVRPDPCVAAAGHDHILASGVVRQRAPESRTNRRVLLRPVTAVPCPGVVQPVARVGEGWRRPLSTEQQNRRRGGVVRHYSRPASGRVCCRVLLRPGGAVPGPRIVENRTESESAEQHHVPSRRVVGNGCTETRRGAGSRRLFGPGRAIPRPCVTQQHAVVRLSTEEDHVAGCGVIRHGGKVPGRRTGGWLLMRPGRAVPGPCLTQVLLIIRATEEHNSAVRGVVCHGCFSELGRVDGRERLVPGGAVPGPGLRVQPLIRQEYHLLNVCVVGSQCRFLRGDLVRIHVRCRGSGTRRRGQGQRPGHRDQSRERQDEHGTDSHMSCRSHDLNLSTPSRRLRGRSRYGHSMASRTGEGAPSSRSWLGSSCAGACFRPSV